MVALNERYILDQEGNKVDVILSMREYQAILDKLEEIDDIRAYDKAMADDSEGSQEIPFEQAVKDIERRQYT